MLRRFELKVSVHFFTFFNVLSSDAIASDIERGCVDISFIPN